LFLPFAAAIRIIGTFGTRTSVGKTGITVKEKAVAAALSSHEPRYLPQRVLKKLSHNFLLGEIQLSLALSLLSRLPPFFLVCDA
jgi:hypothetical protein